jgi:RNA-directed DNA polymerase
MNAIRSRIRELTNRRRWAGMRDIRDVIAVLNPILRGWGGYFQTGNASKQFNSLDRFVTSRLVRLIAQREGMKRRPFFLRAWPHARFVHDFTLYKLLGTIRYPGGTHAT